MKTEGLTDDEARARGRPRNHHSHPNKNDHDEESHRHHRQHDSLQDTKDGARNHARKESGPGADGKEMRSVENRAEEKERRNHHHHHHHHHRSDNATSSSSRRSSNSKRNGHHRHHHRASSGQGEEKVGRSSRRSAEGRAREKERRQHHPSGGSSRPSSTPRTESSDLKGDHRRGPRASRSGSTASGGGDSSDGPMLQEAQPVSDGGKEIDDRLDPLEDVEKAHREKLSNTENVNTGKTIPVTASTNDGKETKNMMRCSKPVLFAFVLLLLGAIAAALWFLVFNEQDPSVSITGSYDPPSFQDCHDIANGVILGGQATMKIDSFNVEIDVHSILVEELPTIMEGLDSMVQQSVLTTLAGCGEEHLLPDQNYVVASGSANVTHQVNETCSNSTITSANGSCFRVDVNIDLYLKGDDAPVERMQIWIEEAFQRDLASSDTIRVISVNPSNELSDDGRRLL